MKKTLLTSLYLCIALCAAAQYFSQAVPFNNVMNSHQVRCVTQDKYGYLWMGSANGLYRYDGYQYQRIHGNGHPDLLPDEAVLNISKWGSRYLWIRLRGDLYSCYDVEQNRFADWNGDDTEQLPYKRYVVADDHNIWLYDDHNGCCHVSIGSDGTMSSRRYRHSEGTLPSGRVTFVMQERSDRAWVGTDSGLVNIRQGKSHVVVKGRAMSCAQRLKSGSICFVSAQGHVYQTHQSGSLNIFTPRTPLPSKVKRVALEGEQLILCTDGGTYCYDTRHRTLAPHPYIHISNAQVVEDNHGNKVVFDRDGTSLWYLTPDKTYHLINIYSKQLTLQNGGGRFKFLYGSQGRIWITTYGNGLFAYDVKTGETTHFLSNDQPKSLLASNYLQNIFEDQNGNLWVCQENLGVCRIGLIRQQQETRYFTSAEDQGHANTIRLIQPLGDRILVGNRQNALWTTDAALNILSKDNPYGDDVVAATTDRQGHLWIGTRNRGIFVDGKPLEPAIEGKVSDIVSDQQGRIWISVFDGSVHMVTVQADGTMQVHPFFQGKHAIAQPRSMVVDHAGRIWLTSNKGVYLFHPAALIKNDTAYQHINVSGSNSNSDEVHCIKEDSQHRIWAGTSGYGLALIDSTGHVTRRYTDTDGLPNNNIESIAEDRDGNLWVGTSYGLGKYIPADDHFYAFYLSDHSLGLMYTEGCATLLKDGRMAMGTLKGMQVFNPRDIKPRPNIFPLAITDIRINGVSLQDIDGLDYRTGNHGERQLRLSHDQNSLTFYASEFEYYQTLSVKFSYWLEGYDKEWNEPSAQNSATYKNLRPGNYTLHVRSYNIYGMQSEQEETILIHISQPWWNTWWAWLLYLLVIGGAAWTAWQHFRQVNDLQNRIKVENQLTEYKLRFFTNISHEFRTPLTIIRGAMDHINAQDEVPGNLKQPLSSMRKSTDRLMRLINELLTFRKMQNEKLHLQLEETDAVDFLRSIFLTFKETAENRRISYQFTTSDREYKMFLDRNFVDKMAYNLLSNAFKYTPSRHSITMRLNVQDGKLCMEVEDTGIGVAKEKQGELFTRFNQSVFSRESIGIGLHLVAELTRVHHGDIAFRENPDGGSIFSITLPTDKSIYSESDFLRDNDLLAETSATTQQPAATTYKEMATPPMNDHRILVVDDDDDIRDFLQTELRRYFIIDTAINGTEALEKIKADAPSLVISDVKMPGMSGFELTRKIRQDQDISDLPIILLTAVTDEEKMVRGTEYGADAYIPKPFNIKFLTAKCRTLIEQRAKLRVRYAKEVVGSTPMPDIIVEDADKKFLERFEAWVHGHISDSSMQATDFAANMRMGRTTFFKKVKQVTGMAPHEYIRKLRLKQALELLQDPTLSVSEVAYKIGFEDPNYFSRIFKDYYGVTASQFKKGGKPKINPDGTPPAAES